MGAVRKEIPVYLSGSGRDTTAEKSVDEYVRGVEHTGAKAVKFKIGGRMSANRDAYPGRTDKLLELAHERLAPKVTLMPMDRTRRRRGSRSGGGWSR